MSDESLAVRPIILYTAAGEKLARASYVGRKPEVVAWGGKTFVLRSDGGYYEVIPLTLKLALTS